LVSPPNPFFSQLIYWGTFRFTTTGFTTRVSPTTFFAETGVSREQFFKAFSTFFLNFGAKEFSGFGPTLNFGPGFWRFPGKRPRKYSFLNRWVLGAHHGSFGALFFPKWGPSKSWGFFWPPMVFCGAFQRRDYRVFRTKRCVFCSTGFLRGGGSFFVWTLEGPPPTMFVWLSHNDNPSFGACRPFNPPVGV